MEAGFAAVSAPTLLERADQKCRCSSDSLRIAGQSTQIQVVTYGKEKQMPLAMAGSKTIQGKKLWHIAWHISFHLAQRSQMEWWCVIAAMCQVV